MTEFKNRIGQAWRSHPVIDGVLCGAASLVVFLLLINFVLPAWAVTFQVADLFVVKLDDWAPWIGISVTVMIWWEARRARNKAVEAAVLAAAAGRDIKAVAVQIDGLLVDRDKAKVKEGEAREKLVGEDTAATLARGQEQGRAMAHGAASPAVPVTTGAPIIQTGSHPLIQTGEHPIPVVDDRASTAAEQSAAALTTLAAAATEDKQK